MNARSLNDALLTTPRYADDLASLLISAFAISLYLACGIALLP